MQDRTINNALLALQRQGGAQGHMAQALLIIRNVPVPRIRQDQPLKRGQTKAIVLLALRDGPKTTDQIGRDIAKLRPTITPRQASQRAYSALDRLMVAGALVRNGRLWGLAQ